VLPAAVGTADQRLAVVIKQHGEQSYWTMMADRQNRSIRALLKAARYAEDSFRKYSRTNRADWREKAINYSFIIRSILAKSGHNRVKFTAPNGPAVKILRRFLAWDEGFERPATQIVEAFRKLGR
jgi:hypothetical protein